MLKIRLQRTGKRGQAMYRLVVTEHTKKPQGKYLELLGSYNPHSKELAAKADRIKHWLDHGAQLSDTANNLLVSKNLVEGRKVKIKIKPAKKSTAEAPAVAEAMADKQKGKDGTDDAGKNNAEGIEKPEEKGQETPENKPEDKPENKSEQKTDKDQKEAGQD